MVCMTALGGHTQMKIRVVTCTVYTLPHNVKIETACWSHMLADPTNINQEKKTYPQQKNNDGIKLDMLRHGFTHVDMSRKICHSPCTPRMYVNTSMCLRGVDIVCPTIVSGGRLQRNVV